MNACSTAETSVSEEKMARKNYIYMSQVSITSGSVNGTWLHNKKVLSFHGTVAHACQYEASNGVLIIKMRYYLQY
jgi:hypothetical protein